MAKANTIKGKRALGVLLEKSAYSSYFFFI